MKRALPIWLLCLAALAASAAAQSLDLTRARVPGGGGVSAGGQFGLFSTVGQSEAAPRSTGGIFTLDAGFLGATIPSPIPTVFFPQGTVVVLEDSGAQTRTTYAVFEPGQAGEPVLPPIYQLSNNNPALFNVAPAIATNRTLTFTPATNANGTALVTVVVRADGVDVATNTFTIVVTAVNDAPAVALTGNVTVLEDAGAQSVSSFATFAAGPSDESAQTPTYALTTDNPALFNVLPAIAADGSLTFTTATNANGSATVTVITVDGAGTANGGGDRTTNTFTLTMTAVNDAPAVAYVANNVVVLEDSGAQSVSGFATFTAGPTGESAQTPAYTLIADNAALFSAQPAIAANGTLTFTPALNANGAATITVITADNGGTAGGGVDRSTNTFSITVTLVNDPPAVAYAMNNLVVREDAGAQTVSGFATFTAGPADEAAQLPAYNLSANNAALFSVQPALAANGTLTFTPATNANGSVTVTVITADTGGTANNGADRSTNSFTITVTAVNDQPSVSYAMGTVTVLEDAGAQTVSGFATFTAGPLDESAQTAAYTLTADNAALFSVQPAIAANGTLTFTPAVNANGSATMTVVLQDSGGGTGGGVDKATNTFTITVAAVNDAPSMAFDTNTVIAVKDTGAQTATGFVTFTAGPPDESSQTPAYTLSSDNTALFSTQPVIAPNGTLTFTPAAGAEGVATVTVVAQDNGGTANGGSDKATNTFAITVVPFSTAPDSYAVSEDRLLTVIAGAGVLTNDVGVGLGVRLVDAATNGTVTLNANGSFTYLPATNFHGTDTFTYQATNSLVASAPTAVSITVSSVNDAPLVDFATSEVVVLEDADARSFPAFATYTAGPTNESAQTLVGYSVSNSSNALFSVQPAIDSTGRLTFTPATHANGSATVTVIVQDSGGTGDSGVDKATNTFVITVTPVNDPPTAALAGNVTVLEDAGSQARVGFVTSFVPGPADESGQTPTHHVASDNLLLFSVQPAIASDGTLTFTPATNANGAATVTVITSDGGGTANGGRDRTTNSFLVTVTPVNDAPSVAFSTNLVAVLEDAEPPSVVGFATFTAGAANESAQALVSYTVSNSSNALFSLQPTIDSSGWLSFTPAANASGTATVTVVVKDNGGVANGAVDASTNSFTIVVTSVNDAPSFTIAGLTANPAGATWTPRRLGLQWRSLASSADGTKLVATVHNLGGQIYTSADSGLTWTKRAPDLNLNAVASSSDGTKLVAIGRLQIFTSTDSGVTWTVQTGAGVHAWTCVASSADGRKLVAGALGGQLYTSTDSGVTWSARESSRRWGWLASSADGSKLVAVEDFGQLYTSSDSGVTWTAQAGAGRGWTCVASSADGTKLVALGGRIYTSTDSGVSWTARENSRFWNGVASSDDGTKLVAIVSGGHIYTSTDSGVSWTERTPDLDWTCVASSADGSKLIAANLGRIYTSVGPFTLALEEDSSAQSLNLTDISPGPANEGSQTLTFTATSSDTTILPHPTINYADGATGTLNFRPAINANGTVTVTVVVQDSGGTADGGVDKSTNTFTLTVTPVNDAPSVTFAQSTVTVLEDAGVQSVSGFATFSSSPINESAQALLGYSVTVDNAALFSVAPAINNAGMLTFTSATNANGSATVTVVVQDSGGTASGGVDKSTNIFTIVASAVNDTPVANNDSYTMNQGDVLTVAASGVLANDTDVENSSLTATKLTNPAHGTIAFNASGGFTYTPDTNFYGVDSFTYRVNDGTDNSAPATVNLTVLARPVITPPPGRQRVFSSAALRFSATNAPDINAIRVADQDSAVLTLTLTVTNGTLAVTVTSGLTFPNGSTNTNTLVLAGLAADVNAALESLAYVSVTNYFGDDALVLVAQDEGGRTNRGNGIFDIQVVIPARGPSLDVPLNGFNNPGLGRTVTNATAVTLDTNLVQGITYDPTNNVVRVQPVGGQDGSTNRSTVTVLARFSDGTTELITVPVIIYQPLLTATTNSGNYDTTFSTPLFNPQTSLYEQKVTVGNNTPFSFTALRITATNLPATVTLQNATLTNGGLPYIEHNLTVPAGGSVTLKLEYFSSDLAPFTPGLRLELLNQQRVFTAPAVTVMTAAALRTGYSPDGVPKIYVQFPTQAGRLYYVQYLDAIGSAWRTSPVTVTGTGFVVQFIDDGPPNTDTAPGRARFYRILTPP